jgi:hypothetical protein
MRFMNLIMLYDFMEVLNIKMKHYTKMIIFLGTFNLLEFIYG